MLFTGIITPQYHQLNKIEDLHKVCYTETISQCWTATSSIFSRVWSYTYVHTFENIDYLLMIIFWSADAVCDIRKHDGNNPETVLGESSLPRKSKRNQAVCQAASHRKRFEKKNRRLFSHPLVCQQRCRHEWGWLLLSSMILFLCL